MFRVQDLGFRIDVQGLGFWIYVHGLGFGICVQGSQSLARNSYLSVLKALQGLLSTFWAAGTTSKLRRYLATYLPIAYLLS